MVGQQVKDAALYEVHSIFSSATVAFY